MKQEKLLQNRSSQLQRLKDRECQSEKREYYLIREWDIFHINATFDHIGNQTTSELIPWYIKTKGNTNSLDFFITTTNGPKPYIDYDGKPKDTEGFVLLYDLRNLTMPPIQVFEGTTIIPSCNFINDFDILCIGSAGYIYKYTLTEDLNTFTYSQFAHINNAHFDKCSSSIQTSNGLILIGGWPFNVIHVYDIYGHKLTELNTNTVEHSDVMSINEIIPGIILTISNPNGILTIHNITNIHKKERDNISKNIIQSFGYYAYTTTSLKREGGIYFALGGRVNQDGLVQICKLEDNLNVSCNEKYIITNPYCTIKEIREIEKGKIFFWGDRDCNQICSWEYIHEDKPKCYTVDDYKDNEIIDIVSICE